VWIQLTLVPFGVAFGHILFEFLKRRSIYDAEYLKNDAEGIY